MINRWVSIFKFTGLSFSTYLQFPKRSITPSPQLNADGGSLLTELLRTIENSFRVIFREHITHPAYKKSREQIHAANEATLQYLFGVVNLEASLIDMAVTVDFIC